MRRPNHSLALSILLPILLHTTPTLTADDHRKEVSQPCTIWNPSNGNFYDLNTITVQPLVNHKTAHKDDRTESWHARGYDYGTNFTLNFCAPVIEDLKDVEGIKSDMAKNISAFYRVGDKTFSIGQTSTEPIFHGRKLTLNYTNGSPCDVTTTHLYARTPSPSSKSSKSSHDDDDDDEDDPDSDKKTKPHKTPSNTPNPRRKSTLISFLCDRDSLAPKAHLTFIGASPDSCTYFFEARSMAACGGVIAASQSLSPGGVFGVIALIAMAVYLAGGVAYQRTVMHQRGWRQLPNYTLWAGIGGFIGDIFTILTSTCLQCIPRRKGYNQLSNGRGRGRDDEANGLIDSYEEEY